MVESGWALNHGVLFTGAGFLMIVCPPVAVLPKKVWLPALLLVLMSALAFLPDVISSPLSWRSDVEEAGLETGDQVAIQGRLALETTVVLLATFFVSFWLLGLRVSSGGLAVLVTIFSLGVAAYAVVSFVFRDELMGSRAQEHFGFFPNRNHTATLLAMGSMTGLGSLVQGVRKKRGWMIALSIVALAICLWAVFSWSVSRAGVVLVSVGVVVWLLALGPGYLRGNTRKALMILGVAVVGGFLIVDSPVKDRLVQVAGLGGDEGSDGKNQSALDFRIPTWLDTLNMISDRPWTGFGAGHFSYVFPQYRDKTAVADSTRTVHPESDWLWFVAEAGVPAGVTLAGLVGVILIPAWRGLSKGKSRAIRAGCMVAAVVLGIHSLFDVPAHRVPLLWAAVFLLGLSLRPTENGTRVFGRLFSRAGGLVVLAVGLWLLIGQKIGLPEPVTPRGDLAVAEIEKLNQIDQLARSEGRLPPADPADDPLLMALDVLEETKRVLPLDYRLHHLEGVIASRFAGRDAQVDRAFEIERLLEPLQCTLPLRQAAVWAPIDPEKALGLVEKTRKRAARLDGMSLAPPHDADSWILHADRRIFELARKFPALKTKE